ncbi:MAG: PspC domain-containing protein [Elusimicrobia bacterium GWA2_61_42]|nr:MAG: PspC domain-containing protein [Elusimicrobia bacterium GWA2_61_42]OGR77856.1 MAG: PspC domain-containing protein [Elusimicrobia bacterium GWC2_61_25]
MKRLYRSNDNKVFAGVLGGLGEYFEVDPVLLRLGFVFLLLATAVVPGVIAYVAAVFIVPKRPADAQR